MSEKRTPDLYEHLPALYRILDAERGYPLRALLEIISVQAGLIKEDIDGLWDDFSIETCADWVIPYIGDLVGNNPLYSVVGGSRADVAKTIYYRRRKGTLPMLEELARDVTGWSVHAVQFFEQLGWTQNLNHLRYLRAPNSPRGDPETMDRVGTANVRNLDALDRLDGPFDTISHTADVRPIGRDEGWQNIRNIGFFIYRLKSYPMVVEPRQSNSHSYGYHFSSLGNPAPLFTDPRREAEETGLATELHVPCPIRPLALHFDLERVRNAVAAGKSAQSAYVGPGKSLAIKVIDKNGAERAIPPEAIVCVDLEEWRQPKNLVYQVLQSDGSTVDKPVQVGVDARRGRLVFAKGQEPETDDQVEVLYHYGFSTEIGGGLYDRAASLADPALAEEEIIVAKGSPVNKIQTALSEWAGLGKPPCIIRIADSGVYGGNFDIQMPKNGWLVIEAANGVRPSVRLVGNTSLIASGEEATLILNGLLIEDSLELQGNLKLTLRHCTMVPGRMLQEDGSPASPDRDSIVVKGPVTGLNVTIDRSIVGALRLPEESQRLIVTDSIIQGLEAGGVLRPAIAADDGHKNPGPPTRLERVTIWGPVYVKELDASEVIFTSPVRAQRRQAGCVRFSYVPDEGSHTPRRYRCQPDLALEGVTGIAAQARIRARLVPSFTSTHYGDPGYAQLSLSCAQEICTGAEDGSEMGVFSHLKQPQRETNLRVRLEEYLPFGLDAGFIYVT
jgi:hypothetical protein